MAKDKIKVSVIIDKKALIDKAFSAAKTQEEFNEVRLIIEDSDEFVRDSTQLEDEERRKAHNDGFAALALDMLVCKYNQTKMAQRMDAENAKAKEAKEKSKAEYEALKKKLGEDNPLVAMLGKLFEED